MSKENFQITAKKYTDSKRDGIPYRIHYNLLLENLKIWNDILDHLTSLNKVKALPNITSLEVSLEDNIIILHDISWKKIEVLVQKI